MNATTKGPRTEDVSERGRAYVLVDREPIQWHLARSTHDRCSRCGGAMGFLATSKRCCMGACNETSPDRDARVPNVTELLVSPAAWLGSLGFSREEAERVASASRAGSRPTLREVATRWRSEFYESEAYRGGTLYRVRPGFLRVA